jgi:hypothetical protein
MVEEITVLSVRDLKTALSGEPFECVFARNGVKYSALVRPEREFLFWLNFNDLARELEIAIMNRLGRLDIAGQTITITDHRETAP